MNTRLSTPTLPLPRTTAKPRSGAAGHVLRLLRSMPEGTLELRWPDGHAERFGTGRPPLAQIRIHDSGVFARVLGSGDVGFGEAFVDGQWSSPDPVALLRLLLRNRQALQAAVYGRWWGALGLRLRHLLNRNSRHGSRRNIHAHYDLGNAFYGLWLDETLNYSSACFDGDLGRTLADAQRAKVARALRASGVDADSRVLEIGCGWGAVAEAAAAAGARVVGVTLSGEQLRFAAERLRRAGLADRAELRLQDYRDIDDGPFDAVVSIEMFEAVGEAYWDTYFGAIRRQLRPGGQACIQTITIRDDLFERYRRSTDFIQQYVFPGGMLPSRSAFRAAAARAGLSVCDEFAFGADYAETLRRWRAAFRARQDEVRRQGFDPRFCRLWDFYLAYCEAAFAEGNTDVVQFTLRKD